MMRKKQELQSFVDGLETKVKKYYDKTEKDLYIESMMKGDFFRNTVKEKKKLIYLTSWFSILIDYTEALSLVLIVHLNDILVSGIFKFFITTQK